MKDLFSSEKLSPIELAKGLLNLKGLANNARDFDQIKKTLIPDGIIDRVSQIIKGLEQEDEFAVLCRLMETCDSISKVGQSPIIANNEVSPDFIASFRPGCSVQGLDKDKIGVVYNCFVEVKSCQEKRFKISSKDLSARKRFAQRFGLPLIFAIRFTLFKGQCYWILIEANKLEKQGKKVNIADLIGNLSPILLDDYGVFTHPQLHLVSYYSKTPGVNGIKHAKHGTLVKTYILLPGSTPIEIEDNANILVNAVLEGFDFKTTEERSENELTCVVSHIGAQMRFLSDMIYRINNLARDESGETTYDATRIITRMDSPSDKQFLIPRTLVENVISYLNSKTTLLFKMGIGDPKDQEKILRSLGRRG